VRTFVAVLLPTELRNRLAVEIDGLRDHAAGVAWVAAENLHVTVKFLGGVDESRLAEIGAALGRAVRVPAFEVGVRGLGAFPSATRARVLWAGAPGSPPFTALAEEVDRALVAMGFAPEGRGFTPHVTLGRVRETGKGRRPELGWLATDGNRAFGTAAVDEVVLFRSDLGAGGARHTALTRFPLPSDG